MEFIGTFFFVFAIVVTGHPIAIAIILMTFVYIGTNISGAHYNPMISLSLMLRGLISWNNLLKYAIAQVLGAISAFFLGSLLKKQISIPEPSKHITLYQAFIIETFFAFILIFTILALTTGPDAKKNKKYSLIICFIVPQLAHLLGPLSGAVLNPAILSGAFSISCLNNLSMQYQTAAMYLISQITAGILGAYAYKYFLKIKK